MVTVKRAKNDSKEELWLEITLLLLQFRLELWAHQQPTERQRMKARKTGSLNLAEEINRWSERWGAKFPSWSSSGVGFYNCELVQVTDSPSARGTSVGTRKTCHWLLFDLQDDYVHMLRRTSVFWKAVKQMSIAPIIKSGRWISPLEILKRKNNKWNSHWKLIFFPCSPFFFQI